MRHSQTAHLGLVLLFLVVGCMDPDLTTAVLHPGDVLHTSSSSTDPGYSAILLSGEDSRALAMSNSGHVVGTLKDSDNFKYAVRWLIDDTGVLEGPIALGELRGVFQEPSSVNNLGAVVGRISLQDGFIFESEMQILPSAPEFDDFSGAYHPLHINDQGMVAGQVRYAVYEDGVYDRRDVRGLLWQVPYDSPPVVLPPLEGHLSSRAAHVDEAGLIMGVSYKKSSDHTIADWTIVTWKVSDDVASAPVVVSDSPPVWFTTRNDNDILGFAEVFRNDTWQALQPLPGHHRVRSFDMAGLNSEGVVRIVGSSSEDGATAGVPVTWILDVSDVAGSPVQLGTPGGRNYSGNGSARAVNDTGSIVGYTFRRNGQHRATLWLPGGDGDEDGGEDDCRRHPRTDECR